MVQLKKKTEISRSDILDLDAYERVRAERRKEITAIKAKRRVPVGPNATFHFESFDTMLYQIQEMLRAERGGEEQLRDELAAYNPMVPQGSDLAVTVMFEVPDPVERHRFLSQLGGVENHFFMEVGEERISGRPERDVERTKADGKTSSVHFIHFDLEPAQIAKFRDSKIRVMVGVDHPNYGHVAILTPDTRTELATDLAS